MDSETESVVISSDQWGVPDAIQNLDLWVMWDFTSKQPLAPWQTGNCYPAQWRASLPSTRRPETDFKTTRQWSELPPRELHLSHPFPEKTREGIRVDDPVPEKTGPTILLPYDPDKWGLSPPLMYIDFDDVRDPETGEVSPEVADLVGRLDSYTEISSSGTGLHVLVWAELPEPLGKVVEDLDDEGSIELYDHGRFLAGTWRHVEGSPWGVNERQTVVAGIIEQYIDVDAEAEVPSQSKPQASGARRPSPVKDRIDHVRNNRDGGGNTRVGNSSSGEDSPYFDVNLLSFAGPDETASEKVLNQSGSSGPQGSHPHHGKTTSGNESTNYHVDPGENRWHCFADASGGGPMEIAAVMAGVMPCSAAGKGSLRSLSDEDFLEACLFARDNLRGFEPGMKPPYRALAALASVLSLRQTDPDQGILGPATYDIARNAYDEFSVAALDNER